MGFNESLLVFGSFMRFKSDYNPRDVACSFLFVVLLLSKYLKCSIEDRWSLHDPKGIVAKTVKNEKSKKREFARYRFSSEKEES